MNPLLFVHVPKTAGTSFRLGADAFFGEEGVCRDYGVESDVTSPIVRDWVFGNEDLWRFKQSFDSSSYQFLTGHFPAYRYVPAFGLLRTVTFLRDPIQRICSEYRHFVRNYNYRNSFEEFYRSVQFINRQLSMFSHVAWGGIGVIGITERFRESLDLINRKFYLDIPLLQENQGRDCAGAEYEISRSQYEELVRLNAAEIKFYEAARVQFEWRLRLRSRGKPYTAGMITVYRNGKLHGWAYPEEGDDPAEVRILINGSAEVDVVANRDRPAMRAQGIGRGGFVGFTAELPNLSRNDLVECEVISTGQPLANSCWRIGEEGVGDQREMIIQCVARNCDGHDCEI